MNILETIFWIWLVMSGVFTVFYIKDFGKFWWKVITTVPKNLWELISKWIGKK